jgi:hypothetical protein
MHPTALLLAASLAASAAAQTCIYTGSADPTAGNLGAGLTLLDYVSGTPYPGTWHRQVSVPAFLFQNVPTQITELSFAVKMGYARLQIAQLAVRMGQTTHTPMSATYA